MFSMEDGKLAVRIARSVVDNYVRRTPMPLHDVPDHFHTKSGVFVTLEKYPSHDLRGCIGFPEPIFPLQKAIESAAKSAAAEDPRFRPVDIKELDRIVVEVSLLTPPELMKAGNYKDYLGQIVIGRDGLIAEKGFARGLLLPQVPVEWGWSVEEFLGQVCWKAGMTPDSWMDENCKIYRFSAEVFSESKPHGEVVRKDLSAEAPSKK